MSESTSTTTCPHCGATAFGNFCSNCGNSLARSRCVKCAAELAPGAKFCHRCGAVVDAAAPRANVAAPPSSRDLAPNESDLGSKLPWAVAGIALVALIALVAVQRASHSGAEAAPSPASNGAGGATGVDISSMTPQERADRLFNRIMRYAEQGKTDSVQFFAPMAIQAFEMLGTFTPDQRYDLGRIAEVAGDPVIAAAQADTILKASPTHLLGLTLAASAALMQKDNTKANDYLRRLAAAAPAERAKRLPEYDVHANDIDAALAQAPKK
jgi:zinc-ribbon domain